MKTKKISSIVLLGFFAAATFSACKKSYSPASQASDQELETQLMNATNNVADFDNAASEDFDLIMSNESSSSNARSTVCYNVTYTPSADVYPHTKTVDYGSGCTNEYGVTKKGKVIITYYDPAVSGGKFSETSYDNYYVNDMHIVGSVKVNKSTNTSGQTVFTHTINKTLTSPDGDVNDWNSNLKFTLIAGGNTTKKSDDVYQITGSAHGKETLDGVEANNWKSDIDKANVVIKPQSCKRRVQGGLIVSIHLKEKGKSDKKLDEYLDYGNGDCDDIATLSINGGAAQQVTLPLEFWPLKQY